MRLAMKLVRAALNRDVDEGSTRVADAGVKGGGLDFEFTHCRLRRDKADAARVRVALDVGECVGDAVERELVAVLSGAVDGELRVHIVRPPVGLPHVGAVDRSGREQNKADGAAAEGRQFDNPPLIDDLADCRFRGAQQRRLGLDFNRVSHVAYLHADVDLDGITDAHLHVLANEFLEPSHF